MATVPRLTPGVENRPAPFVPQSASGATLDNFGGQGARAAIQAGRDLSEAGGVLAKIAVEQQQEDNEREAKRLDVAFSEQLRLLTHGDGTEANPGLYGQRGENALSAAPATQKQIAELRRKMLGATQNARVQELFGDISARRQEQEFGSIARFVTREREVANDTASEARINSAVADAAAKWNDPQTVSTTMAILNGEITSMGARKGWAPEVTQLQLQTARTKAITSMVQAAVREDPEKAEAIYNENKATLLGTARAGIEQVLEQQTMAARSQKESDRILARFGNNETAAIAEAKQITHAKVRDATLDRIVQDFNRRRSIEANQRARVTFAQGQSEYQRRLQDRAVEQAAVGAADTIMSTTAGWKERMEAARKLPTALQVPVEKRLSWLREQTIAIENADLPAMAVGLADRAREQFPDDPAKQFQFVQEQSDAKLRRETERVLLQSLARNRTAREEEIRAAKQEAFRAAWGEEGLAAWSRNNPEKMALISGDGNTPQNLIAADAKRQLNERHAAVSEEGLMVQMRQSDPMQLSRVDTNEFMHRLTPRDFDELSRLVAQAKTRLDNLGKDRSDFSRMERLLDDMAPDLFKPSGKKKSESAMQKLAARQNEIRNVLGDKIKQYRDDNGKVVPDDTLRQWITQALIPVESTDWTSWFGEYFSPRRAAEIGALTEEQRRTIRVPLDRLDPAVKAQMDAALARSGPVTDDRRQKLLRATILSQNPRIPAAERERYRKEALSYTTPPRGQ